MTCKCPTGWCYARPDCRRQQAVETPPRRPPLRDLRLAQLRARRAAIEAELAGESLDDARSLLAARDALDRAIEALQ